MIHTFKFSGILNTEETSVDYFEASLKTLTYAAAKIICKDFPKSYNLRIVKIPSYRKSIFQARIVFSVGLASDTVNGGTNETGLRRIKSFSKKVNFEYTESKFRNASEEQLRVLFS